MWASANLPQPAFVCGLLGVSLATTGRDNETKHQHSEAWPDDGSLQRAVVNRDDVMSGNRVAAARVAAMVRHSQCKAF